MKEEKNDQFDINIFSSPLSSIIDDDIEEQILSPLSCLREFESKWLLEFDLPLVNKQDISVSIEPDNVIIVEAKLKETYSDSQNNFKHEFRYFKKSVSLPGNIDEKKITSSFTNGRLTINIPKLFRGNKIKIE